MKRKTIHLLGFIEFIILFATLLFFVLASDKTMQFVAQKVKKEFHINYDSLEGNLLKNITLKKIRYKDKLLAEKAHIDINFKALFLLDLKIDDITLEEVNLATVESLISDMQSSRDAKSETNFDMLPTIEVTSLFFSTKPYDKYEMHLDEFKFNAVEFKGDLHHLEIGSFSLYTENDVTNITADGSLFDKHLAFNHLWITDVNLTKIETFYNSKIKTDHNLSETNSTTTADPKSGFPALVNKISISDFKTNIKPYQYRKYDIGDLTLEAKGIQSDLFQVDINQTHIYSDTNMWNLDAKGYVQNNKLYTDASIILNDPYFKRFVPFFDFNKVHPIQVTMSLDQEGILANVDLETDNLLIGNVKDLNLSINHILGDVTLDFSPFDLNVDLDGNISTKYTKQIAVDASLYYRDHKFWYDGVLKNNSLQNADKNLTKLLVDNSITFAGDTKKIEATLENPNLKAHYTSDSYLKALVELETNRLLFREYFNVLPVSIDDLDAKIHATIPIEYKDFHAYIADFKIDSNAFDATGRFTFDKSLLIDADLTHKTDTILKQLDPKLKTKALFPLSLHTTLENGINQNSLQHQNFKFNINYDLNRSYLDTALSLNGHTVTYQGVIGEAMTLGAKTNSLKSLQEEITAYYDFVPQPVDGEIEIQTRLDQDQANINIESRWMVYEYTLNKFLFAEKIKTEIDRKSDTYTIQSYTFNTYLDYDRQFQASKPSTITYKDARIALDPLWINDQATVIGHYDINNSDGKFALESDDYHYKGVEGDIHIQTAITALLKPTKTLIEGSVKALKGKITYEAKKEHYIQDDDIIIIQEERQQEAMRKENNLTIDVNILTNQPIQYKVKDTDVTLEADLKLWKEAQKELELLGIVKILEGVHFESKKEFKVENGEILFAGAIYNPFVNINVMHTSDPYEIDININGLLDAPVVNFSSTPYLTQSDILSILLFNSTTENLMGSDTDSSKAAISMFGNTFAKEMVENFGIKLDKLVLTTTEDGGFGLEVGKKISKNITLLYINDIVQTIKVKYHHSRQFETDFTFSPDTSGIDFLYKNEY